MCVERTGQVAVHPLGLGTAQAAGQVQHAGKARAGARFFQVAGAPGQPYLALCIGIGKLHVVHLQSPFVAVHLPARVGTELVERHHRFVKNTGQIECALLHGHDGPATGLVQIELNVRPAHAWRGRSLALGFLRRDLQPGDPPPAPVLGGCRCRALPGQVQGLHQPRWGIGLQGAMDHIPKRQPIGHPAQHRQVEPVGMQLPIGGDGALLVGIGQGHIPARPHQVVIGLELQPLGGKREPLGQPVRRHTALHRMQHQGLKPRPRGGIHPRQRHVGHAALHSARGHVAPDPQGTHALLHRDPQVTGACVPAQLRQIHPGELGIYLPAPALPFAAAGPQQRLAEVAPQAEAAAPGRRRRGIQAHGMAAPAVAQHDVHLLQRQQRRIAQLIGPAQGAVAHHDLALRQQPVGHTRVTRVIARQVQPRHEEPAIGAAAHVQRGGIDVELLQAAPQEGAQRRGGHDAGQPDRLVALAVQYHHVMQLKGGEQPLGGGCDGADLHHCPHGLAGLLFQPWAELVDSRHNPAVQQAPPGHQQQGDQEQQPEDPAHRGG